MEEYKVDLGQSIPSGQSYASLGVNQTYSFIDNSSFYAFVNKGVQDYYFRNVRINLQWYDGFVQGWHNVQNGIFSTRIAHSLVDGVANQVYGKRLSFKNGANTNDKKALDFIRNSWAKDTNVSEVFRTACKFAYATGTTLLKLNQTSKNELWCEAVRNDYFYYETNFKGELKDFTCFVKSYMNTNNDQVNYFIVEHRCFKDITSGSKVRFYDPNLNQERTQIYEKVEKDVPIVEYQIHTYKGGALSNVNTSAMNLQKGLNYTDVPKKVREMIKADYGAIRFNEPMRLPFNKHLGAVLVLRGRDTTTPNIYVGASLLNDIRSDLEEYELAFAFSVRDMWNGQGQVGVPKNLTMGDVQHQQGYSFEGVFGRNTMNYQLFPGDPDKQKPVITQFELRGDQWSAKCDYTLKRIATKIGMSPKIIASYLGDANIQKTATQINSDDDSVIAFVENERSYFESGFNKIIDLVLKHYGYADKVEIKFGNPSLINQEVTIKNADFLYQQGYANLRDTLAMINPDADETQLDELERKAKERQEEIIKNEPTDIDTFGDYLNE